MRIFILESGWQSGAYNMALDEALLEAIRSQTEPLLTVRTYRWETPTLSLGIHQKNGDIATLLGEFPEHAKTIAVVRRPTGGRAILHGADISYSFVTNQPDILKRSLKSSYLLFAGIVRETLRRLSLEVCYAGDRVSDRAYTRSPACFETRTETDMLGPLGDKLTGSAQLRRAGGILQHGAAFLAPYGIDEAAFSRTLFECAGLTFDCAPEPCPSDWQAALTVTRQNLETHYSRSRLPA